MWVVLGGFGWFFHQADQAMRLRVSAREELKIDKPVYGVELNEKRSDDCLLRSAESGECYVRRSSRNSGMLTSDIYPARR